MTATALSQSVSGEERSRFETEYGVDAAQFLDALADRYRTALMTQSDGEGRVSALVGSFHIVWAEHTALPILPDALDEAVLPAALVTVDEHNAALSTDDPPMSRRDTIRREVVPTFYEQLVGLFWYFYEEEDRDHIAKVQFLDGGSSGSETTEQ